METTLYDDDQNVHDHTIQESIRNSINLIIREKPDINYGEMLGEIYAEKKISNESKAIIVSLCDNFKDVMTSEEITYKSLLICVWSIIRKHQYKNDILNVFNDEILDSNGKCFKRRDSY